MFVLDGKPLYLDTQFVAGDINYPINWLRIASPDQRAAIGISEVVDPVRPDDRFYDVSDALNDKFQYDATPKDLDGLKKQWKASVNSAAGSLLATSDWMVVRQVESSVPVPTDWATYRSDVRAYANKVGADLDAATTIDAFIAVATGVTWPLDPVAAAELAKQQAAA